MIELHTYLIWLGLQAITAKSGPFDIAGDRSVQLNRGRSLYRAGDTAGQRQALGNAMSGPSYSARRVAISNRCAAAGVSLLIAAWVSPADWYPVVPLFLGIAFLAAAHVLTPCAVRISQWRESRGNSRESL